MISKQLPVAGNVYGRDVRFFYGTRDEINSAMIRATKGGASRESEKDFLLGEDTAGGFREWEWNRRFARTNIHFICVVKHTNREYDDNTLVHEAAHHVFGTLADAGFRLCRENEEAYCYYLSWIVAQCRQAMRARDKPSRGGRMRVTQKSKSRGAHRRPTRGAVTRKAGRRNRRPRRVATARTAALPKSARR